MTLHALTALPEYHRLPGFSFSPQQIKTHLITFLVCYYFTF